MSQFGGNVYAASTDLNVRILPKDCIFDVVDTGTQELIYYTPEACGFPPVEEQQNESSATPVATSPFFVTPPQTVSRPLVARAPSVLFPIDNSVISSDRTLIEGSAAPGSQINIYENDRIVGSVFTGPDGRWSFLYIATISPVTLRFESCINDTCSVLSDSITLSFDLVLSLGNPEQCQGVLDLEQYRFWDIAKGDVVTVGVNSGSPGSKVVVDWGDGVVTEPDSIMGSKKYFHTYTESGNYTGKVSLTNNECSQERFFSVSVVGEQNKTNPLVVLSLFFFSSLLISRIFWGVR
jgi:hypothetical protein